MQELQCLVFGPFRLDRHDERLWRGSEAIPLPPKTFAVLCCLVTQAGQLVTKDTLLEAVWPETVVTEGVLKGCIRQIRQALVKPGQHGSTSPRCTDVGIASWPP